MTRKEVPSMGCKVEEHRCLSCGETGHREETHLKWGDSLARGSFTFIGASMVQAPLCSECAEPMMYLKRGTEWACRDALCKSYNIPVSTGIGGVLE